MSDPPVLTEVQRWFTPAEANALLPELVPLVEALCDGVDRALQVADLLDGARAPADRWALARDLQELQQGNAELLQRIQDHGVQLKGLAPAMLDFPAWRGGVQVLLCWRQGEPEVGWWHPVHTGARGRQPIDPSDPAVWEYCN